MVQVTVEKPDLGGRGSVKSITLNGIDVMNWMKDNALSTAEGHICKKQDLALVRKILAVLLATQGARVSSMPRFFLGRLFVVCAYIAPDVLRGLGPILWLDVICD